MSLTVAVEFCPEPEARGRINERVVVWLSLAVPEGGIVSVWIIDMALGTAVTVVGTRVDLSTVVVRTSRLGKVVAIVFHEVRTLVNLRMVVLYTVGGVTVTVLSSRRSSVGKTVMVVGTVISLSTVTMEVVSDGTLMIVVAGTVVVV